MEINLSDNAFGPIGVEGLSTFLTSSACYTLEELRLNNCGMGIGGGKVRRKTRTNSSASEIIHLVISRCFTCLSSE